MTADTTFTEVCIVGMGYVGSSLTAVLADAGHRVHGVDINPDIVTAITDGDCPIQEQRITTLFTEHAADGRITATTAYDAVDTADVTIVTVGTPLAESDPDLSAVVAATEQIASRLCAGDTLIYRSTLPAGTTEERLRPVLETHSELTAGEEYALGFCPERMAEGSAYADLTSLPVVVGGLTDDCRAHIESFWATMGNETVAVSSPTAAELTKLVDNWWIDLNIALANEVALLSEQLGVDAMEVIHAANTLPKGEHNVNILFPGAGVGGSCLVKDPWFVANLGEEHGLDLRTPRVSREINDRMPAHMVDLVARAADRVDGESIAVLGYAFKGETDDTRNTPTKPIIEGIRDRGLTAQLTDPYVAAADIEAEVGIEPVRLPEALDGVDVVAIVTGHGVYRELSPAQLRTHVGHDGFAVVDGRHVFPADEFEETSISYLGVGRGHNE